MLQVKVLVDGIGWSIQSPSIGWEGASHAPRPNSRTADRVETSDAAFERFWWKKPKAPPTFPKWDVSGQGQVKNRRLLGYLILVKVVQFPISNFQFSNSKSHSKSGDFWMGWTIVSFHDRVTLSYLKLVFTIWVMMWYSDGMHSFTNLTHMPSAPHAALLHILPTTRRRSSGQMAETRKPPVATRGRYLKLAIFGQNFLQILLNDCERSWLNVWY